MRERLETEQLAEMSLVEAVLNSCRLGYATQGINGFRDGQRLRRGVWLEDEDSDSARKLLAQAMPEK
jgi:hypothetical protein